MSHNPERRERICLNCNTFIYGRYCHKCGQENVEPKETFWHLVTHFVNDVTHFDGKFFSTAKYLLFKPGYLSTEYINGKRMSYLNPIRMYVFTSAIFFIFFFSIVKPEDSFKVSESNKAPQTYNGVKAKLQKNKLEIEQQLNDKHLNDSAKKSLSGELISISQNLERLQKDTTAYNDLASIKTGNDKQDEKYSSVAQYDSTQSKLPPAKRDGWMNRRFKHKKIELDQKFKHFPNAFLTEVSKQFLHSFPQLLFVSLPIIALLLRLLYIRRKNFYYVDHVIYLVHLYCAMFILLFLQISFSKLKLLAHLHWLKYANVILAFCMLFYLYKSLRNFYKQRRAKTVFKFALLLFFSSLIMSFLFAAYGLISLFTV